MLESIVIESTIDEYINELIWFYCNNDLYKSKDIQAGIETIVWFYGTVLQNSW